MKVDFGYAFATPHRLTVCLPNSSEKTLLECRLLELDSRGKVRKGIPLKCETDVSRGRGVRANPVLEAIGDRYLELPRGITAALPKE